MAVVTGKTTGLIVSMGGWPVFVGQNRSEDAKAMRMAYRTEHRLKEGGRNTMNRNPLEQVKEAVRCFDAHVVKAELRPLTDDGLHHEIVLTAPSGHILTLAVALEKEGEL